MSSANVEARIMVGIYGYRLAKCGPDEVTLRNPIRALLEVEVDGKIDHRVVSVMAFKIEDAKQ